MGLVIILAVAAGALAIYARSLTSDPAHWHQMPNKPRDINQAGAALRQITAEDDTLARLDAIIRATPRTVVLAGSVEDGMITYVTRSAAFGFPDYTTVQQDGPQMTIYGRLRIGYADLGVNAKRIDGWLALLRQGG
ncbi:MAG: DUF1499 domain-containing protein [Roseovarius sp.]